MVTAMINGKFAVIWNEEQEKRSRMRVVLSRLETELKKVVILKVSINEEAVR